MSTRRWISRRFTTFLSLSILLIYISSLLYIYNSKLNAIKVDRKDTSYLNHKSLKYILQWTSRFNAPFDWIGEGNSAFIRFNCKHTNCYVTDDRNYFLDQREFDAIAFNGKDVIHLWSFQMPSVRSPTQKYIFAAMESADNYPVCGENLDGFFNWTWTYKLDSDFQWGYIAIYNLNGQIVGPKVHMVWPKMKAIGDGLKNKLLKKNKLIAWFVSHCSTKSGREDYASDLNQELQKSGWSLDVYGDCGTLNCPRSNEKSCLKMIEDDYHFYLSFENSFSEDYVTEKLLTALNNYAVPIVFGGANYSRFLPEESYLDATVLSPASLAKEIISIMANKTRYFDFFRWRNHFVYKGTDGPAVCNLCDMLNNEEKFRETSVWNNFRSWWNGARFKQNCFT